MTSISSYLPYFSCSGFVRRAEKSLSTSNHPVLHSSGMFVPVIDSITCLVAVYVYLTSTKFFEHPTVNSDVNKGLNLIKN